MRCGGREAAGVVGLILCWAMPSAAGAQGSASHTVTINVLPFNRAVFTPPPAMAMRASSPASTLGSYRFATTEHGQKIVVDLDRPLPAGSALAVRMSAPARAVATLAAVVGSSAVDLSTDIRPGHVTTLPMAFIVGAVPVPGNARAERLLTYTIIAGT